MLFDETTLRKLQQLSLVASQVRAGVIKGERRSTHRGSSVEFADYRNYAPGDDLRRLDWNVYARLERPFIKLLEEEEDLAVHILVDASRSMDIGEESQHKFSYALWLTAALGAIGLGAGDHMTVTLLYSGLRQSQYGPARGPQHLLHLLSFLNEQKPAGVTDLEATLKQFSQAARRAGLVCLITDLFSPSDAFTGMRRLLSQGNEINLLHLLHPDEIEPPLAGDLSLVDIETGQTQEVSIDGGMRELYNKRLLAWQDQIHQECIKLNIRYIPISTDSEWDKLVLMDFRQAGMVK
jgi:uncharacterized protein (DUF58 family)